MPLPIWAQSGQRVKISLKDETDTPSSSKQAQQMAVDNILFRRSVHWAYHMDRISSKHKCPVCRKAHRTLYHLTALK